LKWLHGKFQDWDLASAGYNAGENAVIKHDNKVPPYRETQEYVYGSKGGNGKAPQSSMADLRGQYARAFNVELPASPTPGEALAAKPQVPPAPVPIAAPPTPGEALAAKPQVPAPAPSVPAPVVSNPWDRDPWEDLMSKQRQEPAKGEPIRVSASGSPAADPWAGLMRLPAANPEQGAALYGQAWPGGLPMVMPQIRTPLGTVMDGMRATVEVVQKNDQGEILERHVRHFQGGSIPMPQHMAASAASRTA
jgi:hypothetical protein